MNTSTLVPKTETEFHAEVNSVLNTAKRVLSRIPQGESVTARIEVQPPEVCKLSFLGTLFGNTSPERLSALRSALSPGLWEKKVTPWSDGSGGYTEYTAVREDVRYSITSYSIPPTCKIVMVEETKTEEVEEILVPAVTRKVTKEVTKMVAKSVCGPDSEGGAA